MSYSIHFYRKSESVDADKKLMIQCIYDDENLEVINPEDDDDWTIVRLGDSEIIFDFMSCCAYGYRNFDKTIPKGMKLANYLYDKYGLVYYSFDAYYGYYLEYITDYDDEIQDLLFKHNTQMLTSEILGRDIEIAPEEDMAKALQYHELRMQARDIVNEFRIRKEEERKKKEESEKKKEDDKNPDLPF